ncbi:uncharacterized protein N7459_002245 [Penicillium hispanicum]|uniref:uncharacterized protein n=1 Tax=Penicillium hispanicum TaxID=1080232 RepID=UPI0025406E88|nr:uncharacterized protein N7459_002245 [Penicillium hispanicum]KAJ5591876.1 hypothetical protein N7459_002245 [Penicillium hispanicum]
MAKKTQADDPFSREVLRVRAEYEHRRVTTNLYPPSGRPILELDLQRGDKSYMTYWFDDGTKYGQCVRVFDVPGTLSGDILRLRRNLPPMSGHFEIDGNDVRPLDHCLEHSWLIEDDSEDVSELVSKLPLVCVHPAKHFVKKGKYRSEIENLTRSADGQLVFERLSSSARTLGRFSSLAVYKSWILQLIDSLDFLHSIGIVHRDLRADNLLFSDNGERLVVCDLESRWGQRSAPEVAFHGGLEDSGWTSRSDIYAIGDCIKSMVYANGPITHFIEWPVPPPLQAIVEACMRSRPEERPTLADLRFMVEEIQTEAI